MNIHSSPAMTTSSKTDAQTGADAPARPSRASLTRLDGDAPARSSRASLSRVDGDVPARPSKAAMGRGVGDKREAIMTAALDLFVERGFFGTAVPELAER